MVLSLSPGAATCCVRSIFQGMGNWGRRRSRELRGRWRLPAVLSVDKGDGSAQCSPAKPNTSPAGVSSSFASCPAVLGFFTLALLLVVVLVYLQQLRHFPSCRVVPRSPSKSAPCDGINYGDADAACVQNRSAVMKHVSAQKCTSMRRTRSKPERSGDLLGFNTGPVDPKSSESVPVNLTCN